MAYEIKYTDYDVSVNGKLALSKVNALIANHYYTDKISASEDIWVMPDLIVGELTGRYFTDSAGVKHFEVHMFCPLWRVDGMPYYYTDVANSLFDFITDSEAKTKPRMIFKDYRDRSRNRVYDERYSWGNEWLRNWISNNPTKTRPKHYMTNDDLFPYVDLTYNSLCYDRSFTKLGSWRQIAEYFGNADYESYIKSFALLKSNFGGNTPAENAEIYNTDLPVWIDFFGAYKGDNFDNTPTNKFGYFNIFNERNEVTIDMVMFFNGKPHKKHGVVLSKTNQLPTVDDTKIVDDSAYSEFYLLNSFKVRGLDYNQDYYIRVFNESVDGSVAYSEVKTFKTQQIGAIPTCDRKGENIYYRSYNSGKLTFGGEDGDAEITGYTFKIGTSKNNLVLVPAYQLAYYYKSSQNVNMKAWSLVANLAGLLPETDYYFELKVTNQYGTRTITDLYTLTPTSFGSGTWLLSETFSTKTLWEKPWMYHELASSIGNESVLLRGGIGSIGKAPITEYGFVLSKSNENPTIADVKYSFAGNPASEDGKFLKEITNLDVGTIYYYRAYAINAYGVGYSGTGNKFTTLGIGLKPTVVISTKNTSSVTNNSAICTAQLTSTGDINIIERGVCWGLKDKPSYADNYKANGKGVGEFSTVITGLQAGKTYFVRAYAKANYEPSGIYYGEQLQFTTIGVDVTKPTITTLPITGLKWNGSNYELYSGWNLVKAGTAAIELSGIGLSTAEPISMDDFDGIVEGVNNSSLKIDGLIASREWYVTGFAVVTINDVTEVVFGQSVKFITPDVPTNVPTITSVYQALEINLETSLCKITITGAGDLIQRFKVQYSSSPNVSTAQDRQLKMSNSAVFEIAGIKEGRTYFQSAQMDINSNWVYSSVGFIDNYNSNPNVTSVQEPDVIVNGNILQKGGRTWEWNGKAWERKLTVTQSSGQSIVKSPKTNLKISEVVNNEQVAFVIQNTNKIKVIDTLITPPGPGHEDLMRLDLYFDIDMSDYSEQVCRISWNGGTNTMQSLSQSVNNIVSFNIHAIDNGNGLDYSPFDDINAIDVADEVYIELIDSANTNKIIPVNNAKFRIEDVYNLSSQLYKKVDRSINTLESIEELDSTTSTGFYQMNSNFDRIEYEPFNWVGESGGAISILVMELMDIDNSYQIAFFWDGVKNAMKYRCMSSGSVGAAPTYGWMEVMSSSDLSNFTEATY